MQIAIVSAPLGLMAIGLLGAIVAYISYRQRRRADVRAEWWRRVQFAIEMACSDDAETSRIGTELLAALGKQGEATPNDMRLLAEILRIIRGDAPTSSNAIFLISEVWRTIAAPTLPWNWPPVWEPPSWLPPNDVDSDDDDPEGGKP